MLQIIAGRHIAWSVSDTFELEVASDTGSFDAGSTLEFQIARNQETAAIIDKTNISLSDGIFTVSLDSTDRAKLSVGDYIYRIIVSASGTVTTEISGDFIVKWGM